MLTNPAIRVCVQKMCGTDAEVPTRVFAVGVSSGVNRPFLEGESIRLLFWVELGERLLVAVSRPPWLPLTPFCLGGGGGGGGENNC